MTETITLIPGDGIGPEVSEATRRVLDAAGADLDYDVQIAGTEALTRHGDPLPQAVLDSIRRTRVALKGPVTTPVGKGFQSVNVRLRRELGPHPEQYDMLLLENLYGDIVSDLCAGLVGGLGVVAGANIGEVGSVFEAVHGSAPDIAGQNKANPLALMRSAILMLEAMDKADVANRIRRALRHVVIERGVRTADLGGEATTSGFTDAVVEALELGVQTTRPETD